MVSPVGSWGGGFLAFPGFPFEGFLEALGDWFLGAWGVENQVDSEHGW